jgi:hypothetical protein
MSAYTNPETYIDTQSAQAYQRLQDTISGSFSKVAQSYTNRQKEIRSQLDENAKQIRANDMKAQEYAFSLYTDLGKSTQSDPSVDWAKTYEPLIQEAVQIRSGMLNGTLGDKQAAMKRLGQIQGSVDNVTGSLGTLSAAGTAWTNGISKGVSTQGGVASSNDPKITDAMNILTQRLPGSKEVYFKDTDPTKLIWRVKDQKGNILHEFDADQLKRISQGNGLIRTIPNQTAEFDKLKSTNSSIFEVVPPKPGEKGDPLPTGKINPDFLVKGENGKPKVIENIKIDGKGVKVTTYEQEVDINAIKNNSNFKATLTAQAEGLLKANQSSAIDFYNDIIHKPQGRWKGVDNTFDPNKPLDPEEQKKFIEDYKEYYINTQIMPIQGISKPNDEDVSLVQKITDSDNPYKGKKGESTKGMTKTQINQKAFNDRIADVINTRKGAVTKGDYTFGLLNGKWAVYDKYGNIKSGTEGITNPTELSSHIGGTLKAKPKLKI